MDFYAFNSGDPVPCRAVIGTFDGMHAGHRALFARGQALSRADGLSLGAVVIERQGGVRLCSLDERLAYMRDSGADFAFVFALSQVRELSCAQFAALLRQECRVRACVCGFNFRFGRDRAGDAAVLRELLPTQVVPAATEDGQVVSSTLVKELIASGNVARAARLLCRAYSVSGRVDHGRAFGRTIGFPTANIAFAPDAALPARGVYVTRSHVDGKVCFSVTNVGTRPTVGGSGMNAESHLLDFDGDLYGKVLTVEFLDRLRDEIHFSSIGALREQIGRDVASAREKVLAQDWK